MMKKILLTVVVLVIVLVGWIFLRNKEAGKLLLNTPTPMVTIVGPSPVIIKNVITYTDSGYIPNTITIKKGEIVIWKNESSVPMWTASAGHPTHKTYPDTNIALCLSLRPVAMFDACKTYGPGESWSFAFYNVGTWGYHNHVKASHWGKIIVE